jgi:hypothetical protein
MEFDSSGQEFDLAWKHRRSAGAPPSVPPRGLLLERMIGRKMTKSVAREVGNEGETSESIIRIDSDRSGFRKAQYAGRQATGNDREISSTGGEFCEIICRDF